MQGFFYCEFQSSAGYIFPAGENMQVLPDAEPCEYAGDSRNSYWRKYTGYRNQFLCHIVTEVGKFLLEVFTGCEKSCFKKQVRAGFLQ